MDEVLYEVPTQTYHKYVVTYQNGILKKYKSTNETAVPTNLVKAGEGGDNNHLYHYDDCSSYHCGRCCRLVFLILA